MAVVFRLGLQRVPTGIQPALFSVLPLKYWWKAVGKLAQRTIVRRRKAKEGSRSRQLGVFSFRLLENRDVWVGVFPSCKKVLVGGSCLYFVSRQFQGPRQLAPSRGVHRVARGQSGVGQQSEELSRCFRQDGYVYLYGEIAPTRSCALLREATNALGHEAIVKRTQPPRG